MWYQSGFIKYAVGIILVLTILYLTLQLYPILSTIFQFISTLALPLLIAGLLYYILRPLRDWFESKKIPRIYAIILIYLILIGSFSLIVVYLWPFFSKEIDEFTRSPENKIQEVQQKTISFMNLFNFKELSTTELRDILKNYLTSILDWFSKDILNIMTQATKIASYMIFTPFILFYLLKDGDRVGASVSRSFPKNYRPAVRLILGDLDETLSIYISGQFTVALIVGALLFIGYLILGLPYAFLLALFALIFNLIPFVGTFISTIPALLVGFGFGPWVAAEVLLLVLMVHALDANIISPYILGHKLNIHPITIILLLIASGATYGIMGLLLATPLYALLKVFLIDLYYEKDEVGL
jgi:predicted PurR-regulated permease PerM